MLPAAMNAYRIFPIFSIFREEQLNPKREAERYNLMHLLLRLDEFIKFSDVTFGQDPPDFVFHHQNGAIGVELTDLNPKVFEEGGHQERAKFKSFEAEVAQTHPAQAAFHWGKFSLRDSLEALKAQLESKRKKAQPWFAKFAERWLLFHVPSGCPLLAIFTGKHHKATPGMGNEADDYFAKVTHAVYSICQEAQPFDQIILFRESDRFAEMVMFSSGNLNPHKLPVPRDEILRRGAQVSDSFLDWKSSPRTIIKTRRVSF
jgi:hypothetical protein